MAKKVLVSQKSLLCNVSRCSKISCPTNMMNPNVIGPNSIASMLNSTAKAMNSNSTNSIANRTKSIAITI